MKSPTDIEGEADRDSVDSLKDAQGSEYDTEPTRHHTAIRTGSSPENPPPRYYPPLPNNESLHDRLNKAKHECFIVAKYLHALISIFISTKAFTIIIALYLAMPVSMIVMGGVYLHACPAERLIPIYLLVFGCCSGASSILGLVFRLQRREHPTQMTNMQKRLLWPLIIVNCFILGLFIAGSSVVYCTKDEFVPDNPDDPKYCHETLYWFSFWIITSGYIVIGAILLIIVILFMAGFLLEYC